MTNHRHRHARLHPSPLDAEERAGQRLGKGRAARGQARAQAHDIGGAEPGRQGDEFAVGAVDEEEVLAQIVAAFPTEAALATGRRIGGDHAVSLPHSGRARSHARHRASKLVAEDGGNVRNHHGVAAAQHLDVRPAREGGLDPDDDPPGLRLGNREVFEAEISRSMEDLRPHGVMYTLTASWRRISSTPRASSPRGSRWVMSPSTRIRPVASASKASRSSVGDDEYVEEMVSSRW